MVVREDLRHDPRPVMLVLRALKLGDLLVAVPALRALRRAHPGHRIVLATTGWLRPVVELVEAVDELAPTPGLSQPIDVAGREIDLAVNLHGRGPESADLLTALHPHRLIAHHPDAADGPPWVDGMLERERWARLVRAFGVEADADEVGIAVPAHRPVCTRAAVVHVGAFYGSRRWPAERFAEVARHLERTGETVVLTGGDADRERAIAIARAAGLGADRVLAGRLELAEFAAVVASARLLVSVDTGAAHLASAYRVPSVVIFGPAPPSEWGPPPGPHVVLTRAELRRGDTFSDEPDPALLAIRVDEVVHALDGLRAGA
ncbi:glycosyltransferase family 9 protein [Agromyces aerolatus]|uniref:glycosyltransferase family 9 protein n=1 Tax=Agromyces sp. LY-1074 TaxID=3074080 RepID=UPI0028575F0A|nr:MULTISPECIES: glycosyltransferase family 9 protein [unclassified Agromyces]MDR5700591.1 glycosyltransferase family 9 protein [Agromyces sp. LY-1074]MDR5707112.1 glycosyltransferase family 9 protein [Agromyces sp. LY-1358]